MDFLSIIVGMVLGLVFYAFSRYGYFAIRRMKWVRRVSTPTNYDTRIDRITKSGTMRYKLHKATSSLALRESMKSEPIYAKAASILGWDD